MKVREALTISVSVQAWWIVFVLAFASWQSFLDDRPFVGSYLLLILSTFVCTWFKGFARRRIAELGGEDR